VSPDKALQVLFGIKHWDGVTFADSETDVAKLPRQAAPRQKPPRISPIFKADTVRLHVSREKDGKSGLVYVGWDDTKVVQPDGCGQVRRGWKGGSYPAGMGER
jgi:hypothetical protein